MQNDLKKAAKQKLKFNDGSDPSSEEITTSVLSPSLKKLLDEINILSKTTENITSMQQEQDKEIEEQQKTIEKQQKTIEEQQKIIENFGNKMKDKLFSSKTKKAVKITKPTEDSPNSENVVKADKPKIGAQKKIKKDPYTTKLTSSNIQKMKRGDSTTDLLGKIYNFTLIENRVDEKNSKEDEKYKKLLQKRKERQFDELFLAVSGDKALKNKKSSMMTSTKNKKSSLLKYGLLGALGLAAFAIPEEVWASIKVEKYLPEGVTLDFDKVKDFSKVMDNKVQDEYFSEIDNLTEIKNPFDEYEGVFGTIIKVSSTIDKALIKVFEFVKDNTPDFIKKGLSNTADRLNKTLEDNIPGYKQFEESYKKINDFTKSLEEFGSFSFHNADSQISKLRGSLGGSSEGETSGSGSSSSSGNSSGSAGATGQTGIKGNANEAMDFFISKGWTPEQAAGIVGNLVQESNLNPSSLNPKENAQGIAQWTPYGRRQQKIEEHLGKPILKSSFKEQLGAIDWELRGSENRAAKILKNSTTVKSSAEVFDEFYERSAGTERKDRINNAERIFSEYASKNSTEKINPITARKEMNTTPEVQPVTNTVTPGLVPNTRDDTGSSKMDLQNMEDFDLLSSINNNNINIKNLTQVTIITDSDISGGTEDSAMYSKNYLTTNV